MVRMDLGKINDSLTAKTGNMCGPVWRVLCSDPDVRYRSTSKSPVLGSRCQSWEALSSPAFLMTTRRLWFYTRRAWRSMWIAWHFRRWLDHREQCGSAWHLRIQISSMNLTAISYISQTGDQAHTQPASLDRIFVGENAVFGSGQNHDTMAWYIHCQSLHLLRSALGTGPKNTCWVLKDGRCRPCATLRRQVAPCAGTTGLRRELVC